MKLWCQNCDLVLVDSNDPKTGKIWQASGHVINYKKQKVEDTYSTVVFSICKNCLVEQVISKPSKRVLDEFKM